MPDAPTTRTRRGELAGSRWEMSYRSATAPLDRHVLRLCGYDEQATKPQAQRQFPVPVITLIIPLGPPLDVVSGDDPQSTVRHARGFVAGLGDTYSILRHDGRQRGIQVDLTPTGARRLFGVPMSVLTGRTVEIGDLLPVDDPELAEQLDALPDWPSRLDRIEDWLARRLLDAPSEADAADWAMRRIVDSGGLARTGALARELGCSPRHLIGLFHDRVGVTPKRLARLVRFDGLMRAAARGHGSRWIELAIEHGYCDQAHLARDVRQFTGLTPTEARGHLAVLAELLG